MHNEVGTCTEILLIFLMDRSLFKWGGGGGIMGWARPIFFFFFEKRGEPKENFTMIGGGVIVCKESHSLQFMWKI